MVHDLDIKKGILSTKNAPRKAMYSWLLKANPSHSKSGKAGSSPEKKKETKAQAFDIKFKKAIGRLYCSVPTLRARLFDSESFQIFINTIFGRPISIPCSNTILRYVEIIYNEDKESIIDYLKKNCPPVVSLIFDLWTEDGPYKRNFLNVQLQFSIDFQIKNLNLATCLFNDKKTGPNIAEKLLKIIKNFGLFEKFVIFMNDCGGNCLLAVEILLRKLGVKGMSLHCLTHGLHNLINADLLNRDKILTKKTGLAKELGAILEKIRGIRSKLIYKSQEVAHRVKKFRTIESLKLMAIDDDLFEDAIEVSKNLVLEL